MGLFGGGGGFLGNVVKNMFSPVTGIVGGKLMDTGFNTFMGGSKPPPGYAPSVWEGMGSIEQQAGAKPPEYESMRDAEGNLKKQFQYDPYAGQASQALKEQAFSTGESPWAKMQTEMLGQQQMQARDMANKQGMQAMGQGEAELARFGGLGGGARERLAAGGAKNLLMANQDINRQGLEGRMNIGQQDLARKENLLSNFAANEGEAQQRNIGSMQSDIAGKSAADMNRYNQIMQAWAANKSADAQARASASMGGGGGKGK